MSKKLFYVEYLEDSPTTGFVMREPYGTTTEFFSKGPAVQSNHGFNRKRDAVAYCQKLNDYAGRQIVQMLL